MDDLIKMLLQAEIDADSIQNIKGQIDSISDSAKPIKLKVQGAKETASQFDTLNKQLAKLGEFDLSKTPIHKGMEIIGHSFRETSSGVRKFTQTLNDGKNNIITYSGELNRATNSYEILGKSTRQATRDKQTFIKELDIAIRRSITWAMGMTTVYGSLNKMREGIGFIKELDKELTQVSIVTGQTRQETYQLAQEYARLGDNLDMTVKDISAVNTELVRQGLAMEEAQNRLTTIMKLNAVSDVDTDPRETLKVITSSVNALKTEAEDAANVILKASQISASSVGEIGDALTKTASSAEITGMTIEQVVAIISTLEEVTQESASSLGNSVKTLLARFNKVNQETGEMNEELNDVQAAFESVGVAFLDSEKQIRPVYDLLTDLSPIWKDLDKNTKNYIATMAAGVRQQNRFFAIMENFSRVREIQGELVDSSNVLNDAFAKYQDSAEAAANRAALAFEKMWLNAINSEAIKEFYNISTALLNMIDKFGLLRSAVFAVSFIMLTANNRFRTFGTTLVAAVAEMGLFQGSLVALGVTMDATKVKATLMWAALSLGASLLISKAIEKINGLINKHLELQRANEELVQSYEQNVSTNNNNIQRLSEMAEAYDSIRAKIDSQIELNEEEKRTLDEIIKINPSLIKGYNDRGEAIIDTTQNIHDMVEELHRANEIEDIKLAQGGEDFFKAAKKDAKDLANQLEKTQNKIKNITDGKLITKVGEGEIRLATQGLKALENQYMRLSDAERNTAKGRELIQSINEKRYQLRGYEQDLDALSVRLRANSEEVRDSLFAQTRLSDAYRELSVELKSFVSEYINTLDVADFDNFRDMQISIDQLTESLSNADFTRLIDQYSALIQGFEDGKYTAEEFDEKVNELIEEVKTIEGIPDDIITRIFKDSSDVEGMVKGVADSLNDFSDGAVAAEEAVEELNKAVKSALDAMDFYGKVLDELNTAEGLSADSKRKIMTEYDHLLPYMFDEAALKQELIRLHDEEGEIARKVVLQKMWDNEDFYNTTIRGNAELIRALNEYYGVDFENFKSLADAKGRVEQALINELSRMWGEHFGSLYRNIAAGNEHAQAQAEQVYMRNKRLGIQSQSMGGLDAMFRIQHKIGSFESMAVSFSGISGIGRRSVTPSTRKASGAGSGSRSSKKPTSGSSSSGSTTSQKEEYRAEYDRYIKLEEAITKVNIAIKYHNELIQQKSGADHIKLLEKQVKLYEKQQKNIINIRKARIKERDELERYLKKLGFKFTDTGDEGFYGRTITNAQRIKGLSKDAEEAYNRFFQLNEQIMEGTNEWQSYKNQILDTRKEIEELNKALVINEAEEQKRIASIKIALNEEYLKQRSGRKHIELLEEQIKLYEEMQKAVLKERRLYKDLGMYAEFEETTIEWQKYKNQILETKEAIEDMNKALVQNIIQNKKRNALLDIERRERKAEERLKKYYDESIQPEIDRYNELIDAESKIIEKIEKEEKLKKETEERANRIKNIKDAELRHWYLQNDMLGEITEEQAKQVGLEAERERYLENQTRLQKLQLELENTRRQRNIQQLTKKEDGTWEFEYVADQSRIDDINSQIEDMQNEHNKNITKLKSTTLDELRRLQEEYDEWERVNALNKEIEERREKIRQYENDIKDLEEHYRKIEQTTKDAFQTEKENLERHHMDIDMLTDEKLKELRETYKDNWGEIYDILDEQFDEIEKRYDSLVKTLSKPLSMPNLDEANYYTPSSIPGYSSGGKVTKDHLAVVHGSKNDPEWILRDRQFKDAIKTAVLSTVNIVAPTPPKTTMAGVGGDTVYYIDQLTVPTDNFDRFIKDFTNVVENYPNKTIMKVKKIGKI